MSRLPPTYNGLQVTLLALLPKDGTHKTVAELARLTGTSQPAVTNALFDPYMDRAVNFDVRADAYFVERAGNDLPTERKTT